MTTFASVKILPESYLAMLRAKKENHLGNIYAENICPCSGRTFPTHQYFSAQLGAGQLSLYNILKAYSLLDTEVHTVLFPLPTLHHCT